MKTVGVLFGIMMITVGVLLVVTGGGCTVFVLSMGIQNALSGGVFYVSLLVFAVGGVLIWSGAAFVRDMSSKDPPDTTDVF